MKITIIGPSGGGKSTLSRRVSREFGIPRFEIDRIWFKHDGHKYMNGSPDEKAIIQDKIRVELEDFLAHNESWVCDGTYSKIQPLIAGQADTVVLIQRPLIKRIQSHIVRILRGEDRHPEVTRSQDMVFTKVIIKRWLKNEDANLGEFVKQYQHKLVVLRSFADIDHYFKSLTNSK